MIFIFSILAVSIVSAVWVHRLFPKYSGWIISIFPFTVFVYAASLMPGINSGRILKNSWNWVPSLNIQFSLYLDSLSLLFLLLITGIGGLVLVYAGSYFGNHPQSGRFYTLILLFMTAMVGIVVAGNLILLFVFWEITSITSYLLIGFKHENEEARKSALRALIITGSGSLAMLAGIILMGFVAGTYEYTILLEKADLIQQSPFFTGIIALLLIGAFTKSAQFPFHFWLPGAMAAPTPVSSYLHSATMVKAGFFLLLRLGPILGSSNELQGSLMIIGSLTMLFGAIMAVGQPDLKKLLAYSTISALGLLFLLIGINTQLSIKAAIVFLIVHSLYKGALFMIAGIIDHTTGTRDVRALSGLLKHMPLVAIAAGLAAFSMSGTPPLIGFIGKELVYEAKVKAPEIYQWILPITILANALNVAVALIVGVRPFLRSDFNSPLLKHKVSPGLWLGPVLLAIPGLLLGVFPSWINELSNMAASTVRAENIKITLSLWHGFNLVLMMSFFTLVLGMVFFGIREKLRKIKAESGFLSNWGPRRFYESGFNALLEGAKKQTDWLQNGSLRIYLSVIMSVVVLGLGYTLINLTDWLQWRTNFSTARFYEWVIVAVIALSTLILLRSPSRLISAICLGVIGFTVALVFVLYSAPDLAITQVLVETLTVILFVSVVYHLPGYKNLLSPGIKWFNVLLSVAFGGLMTLLTLKASNVQLGETISWFFTENSLTQGFGKNVVNVVLVDFRALDTLGEIVVLTIAAIGVVALLRLKPNSERKQ